MKRFLLALVLSSSVIIANGKDFIITRYGVSTDSTKLQTNAIQQVINTAAKAGGGTIVIPKGVFLTGALFFKPNTQLRLSAGAVLKGSDNISHYPLIPSRMEGRKLDYYAALINAYQVNKFSITGPGKIDGNGLKYWKAFWAHRDSLQKINQTTTNLEVSRPRLLFIWGCNNVKIQNVKLHNSGFWTTHLYQCKDVLMENCDIRSPFSPVPAPSTDGIDIDVCKDVTVRGCYIAVNDDGVCIKGGKGVDAQKLPENGSVENVLVENCTFGPCHSTLTVGSESIHANNITMRNCKVDNKCPILKLKMRPDTYQIYENIKVENITGNCGVIIDMNPWTQFFNLNGSTEKPFGTVRNITLANINVNCSKFGSITGNPNDLVSNLVFQNIQAKAQSSAFKNNHKDVKFENVMLNGVPLQAQ